MGIIDSPTTLNGRCARQLEPLAAAERQQCGYRQRQRRNARQLESDQGLDPNNSADGAQIDEASGYTHLERYLSSLVANISAAQNEGGNGGTTGLHHPIATDFQLHPNPAGNQLTIMAPWGIHRIELINQTGLRVQTHPGNDNNTQTLELNTLQPGLYLVRCFYATGTASTQKLIKR